MPAELENPRTTPNWRLHEARYRITLFHAVCLAHDIRASRNVFNRLVDNDDPRVRNFDNDLITLKDHFCFDLHLRDRASIEEPPKDNTKILLCRYVEWVYSKKPFGELVLPEGFLALKPLVPSQDAATTKATLPSDLDSKIASVTQSAIAVETPPSPREEGEEVKTATHHRRERPLEGIQKGTAARVLLALAVKHYQFKPIGHGDAPSDDKNSSVYAPIARLCEVLGLRRPGDWQTVKNLLVSAQILLHDDELRSIREKIDKKEV